MKSIKHSIARRRFNCVDILCTLAGGALLGSGHVWLSLFLVVAGYFAASVAEATWA